MAIVTLKLSAMKKSLILMCIGGMLALCTPLTAGEAIIDPPVVKHQIAKNNNEIKAETATEEADVTESDISNNTAADTRQAHTGGYVVISAGALLLILILLILLL